MTDRSVDEALTIFASRKNVLVLSGFVSAVEIPPLKNSYGGTGPVLGGRPNRGRLAAPEIHRNGGL